MENQSYFDQKQNGPILQKFNTWSEQQVEEFEHLPKNQILVGKLKIPFNTQQKQSQQQKQNEDSSQEEYESVLFHLIPTKIINYEIQDGKKFIHFIIDLDYNYSIKLLRPKEIDQSKHYGFRLIDSSGENQIFYSKSKDAIKQWFDALKPYVIQTNYQKVYQETKQLGKGAFGEVLAVKNTRSSEMLAAKKYYKTKISSFHIKRCVFCEIKMLRILKGHPFILEIYEVFEEKNCIYIITEILNGGDLFEYLNLKKLLSEQVSFKIFYQLATALEYIHQFNFVHRDLKLQNILFISDQLAINDFHIKICDFGLAEFVPKNKLIKLKCGTHGYMAPEILQGHGYRESIDVFACGVMLFMLVCGRPPFKGVDAKELARSTIHDQIVFRKKPWETTKKSLRHLIMMMTSKDSKHRQTFSQILQDDEWVRSNLEDIEKSNDKWECIKLATQFNENIEKDSQPFLAISHFVNDNKSKTEIIKIINNNEKDQIVIDSTEKRHSQSVREHMTLIKQQNDISSNLDQYENIQISKEEQNQIQNIQQFELQPQSKQFLFQQEEENNKSSVIIGKYGIQQQELMTFFKKNLDGTESMVSVMSNSSFVVVSQQQSQNQDQQSQLKSQVIQQQMKSNQKLNQQFIQKQNNNNVIINNNDNYQHNDLQSSEQKMNSPSSTGIFRDYNPVPQLILQVPTLPIKKKEMSRKKEQLPQKEL